MKTLYLLRHAKSSWDDPTLADHDRPLAPRGERNLATMGTLWAERGLRPERIVSSTAERARSTASAIAEALNVPQPDRTADGRLYATTPEALLAVLGELDTQLASVMIVGHNPEFTALAQRFVPEIEHLPTCALAAFSFCIDAWSELATAVPVHASLESPKQPLRKWPAGDTV